ncbi:hypothetical protein M8J75_012714 [Diaphorina citri]|nr:hypothetical protein M8J75_012714 [Diaphorina citri]
MVRTEQLTFLSSSSSGFRISYSRVPEILKDPFVREEVMSDLIYDLEASKCLTQLLKCPKVESLGEYSVRSWCGFVVFTVVLAVKDNHNHTLWITDETVVTGNSMFWYEIYVRPIRSSQIYFYIPR